MNAPFTCVSEEKALYSAMTSIGHGRAPSRRGLADKYKLSERRAQALIEAVPRLSALDRVSLERRDMARRLWERGLRLSVRDLAYLCAAWPFDLGTRPRMESLLTCDLRGVLPSKDPTKTDVYWAADAWEALREKFTLPDMPPVPAYGRLIEALRKEHPQLVWVQNEIRYDVWLCSSLEPKQPDVELSLVMGMFTLGLMPNPRDGRHDPSQKPVWFKSTQSKFIDVEQWRLLYREALEGYGRVLRSAPHYLCGCAEG